MRTLCILACISILACGDDDLAADAAASDALMSDVQSTDAPGADGSGSDAAVLDGAMADARTPDALVMSDGGDDARAVDAAVDAGDDAATPDAGPSGPCEGTRMGAACASTEDCGDLNCADGVCMPPFSHGGGCGGFAGARCEEAGHPHCAYQTGASAGPCLNDAESACACTVFSRDYVCF